MLNAFLCRRIWEGKKCFIIKTHIYRNKAINVTERAATSKKNSH
jgi:hypothetical protein